MIFFKMEKYSRLDVQGQSLSYSLPVLVIANFCSLPLMSFGQALGKLQGKVVTHSEEVGWWRTLMVECVTLF